MADIDIRIEGCAGRITLNRPKALNALTYDMAMAIHAALRDWAGDDAVRLIVIDAAGDKAFCAGGDIADLYRTGTEGDFAYGRKFWADEYRMNAALFEFPKPVVSLMQGFTMGGGVGVGCHGSHRIVGDSSQIAMPECGIGLVPDVGGSMILARAPGRLGEYLGTTAARLGAADAILAGFADTYIPEGDWPALIAELCRTGDVAAVAHRRADDVDVLGRHGQEAQWCRQQAVHPPLGRGQEPAGDLELVVGFVSRGFRAPPWGLLVIGSHELKGTLGARKRVSARCLARQSYPFASVQLEPRHRCASPRTRRIWWDAGTNPGSVRTGRSGRRRAVSTFR